MSSAKSFILSVLRILSPSDLLSLTEVVRGSTATRQMAAGAELLGHGSADHGPAVELSLVKDPPPRGDQDQPPKDKRREGKIIEFPSLNEPGPRKKGLGEIGVLSSEQELALRKEEEERHEREMPTEVDFLLEERGRFKESEDKIYKQNGLACYRRSSDLSLFRVTVTDDKGKERSMITPTQGVLVNKKQA